MFLVAESAAKGKDASASWFLSLLAAHSALFPGSFYLKWRWTTPKIIES